MNRNTHMPAETLNKKRAGKVSLSLGHLSAPEKGDRLAMISGTILGSMMFSTGICCAESNLFGKISDVLKEFYGYFAGISTGVFALVAVVCLLMMSFDSEEEARRWSKRLRRAAICWVTIMVLGSIIAFAQDIFSGMGYTG